MYQEPPKPNPNLCCVVRYSRARASLRHLYEVASEVLPRATRVRDLGLEMVPDLTFRQHIIKICAKSFRITKLYLVQPGAT
ncbi:putative rna-directed dna polymerase from transposon bs [Operophtera brumata]|uniref:Putative rna-directed dna polymerase from transposon bs n=1 Tax=Operophtera brumata TaxID=104452 RepID=A0A0L7L9Q3_OPEBR|nr:putative rna-directed dna polymerase from transposon bs [Operophtera brumata]